MTATDPHRIRFPKLLCHARYVLAALLAVAALSGCERAAREVEAPPRAETVPPVPAEASLISAPVELDANILRRAIEDAVPQTLWSIDQHFDRCVPPQRVKVLGARIKLAPKIGCRVVGTVTRGAIRLRGQGRDIIAELPIRATIRARDVGGVLKGETATGSAMARAIIHLDMSPDWTPRAKVDLQYDWTRAPGIDFLGKRIEFTRQADAKLRPVVRRLERDLPRLLSRVKVRPEAEKAWRSAFTTMPLNSDNPPVWLRLTPQEPVFGGYRLDGRTIRLDLGLKAVTETYVGERPEDPEPVALPALAKANGEEKLQFFLPVTAEYKELQPVIARALAKRAKRPFEVPKLGFVDAMFDDIVVYGTDNGRIAVGATITATPRSGPIGKTKGRIWMTALPANDADSAEVRFTELSVSGDIQRTGGQLLVDLANGPDVTGAIAGSLTQNFAKDLDGLVEKVRKAVARKQHGKFLVRATIDEIETGEIEAFGSGLYLPVRVSGKGRISYAP